MYTGFQLQSSVPTERKSHGGKSSVSTNANRNSDALERSLTKPKVEVSLSLYSFLFAEMVKYSLSRAQYGQHLEDKLHEMGIRMGYKVLDLICYREKGNKRETRFLNILTFVSQNCWRFLFGHCGDLLKSAENENEYMISDKNLLLNKFTSSGRDAGHVNCGAFAAGIVEGILCSAEFPAAVSAHTVEEGSSKNTTMLIIFLPEVLAREKKRV